MRAGLWNLPSTEEARLKWSFINADQHLRANQRIQDTLGLRLDYYILDPIPENPQSWLYRHQQSHNQINSALHVIGNDLTDVDWNNEVQLRAWIELHAFEHLQWSQKLSL